MPKLATLLVSMEMETKQLRKELDSVNTKFNDFAQKTNASLGAMKTAGQAFSLSLAKDAVGAIGKFVLGGSEALDSMGKLAQSAGVAVEPFSRMAYGFKLAGVDSEGLSTAFRELNKNIAEAAGGSAKQASLFKALGVAVKDANGHIRGADQVMGDLAEAFSKLPDGVSKSNIAMDLLGSKVGTKLLPAFKDGKAGLEDLGRESDRFGNTVTAGAAAAAEAFNDNLERLHTAFDGIAKRVAANVAPAMTKLSDDLLKSSEGTEFLNGAVTVLTATFKALVSAGLIVAGIFELVGKEIGRAASIVANVLQGNFREASEEIRGFAKGALLDFGETSVKTYDKIARVWKDSPIAAGAKSTGDAASDAADKIAAAAARAAKAQEEAAARAKKAAEEQRAAFKSLGDMLTGLQREALEAGGASPVELFKFDLDFGKPSAELAKMAENAGIFRDALIAGKEAAEKIKLDKSFEAIAFDFARSASSINAQASARAQAHSNIGAPTEQLLRDATLGFSDFNSALKEATAQQLRQADMLRIAKVLEATGSGIAARAYYVAADEAGRAAEKAGAAADAFDEIEKQQVESAKALAAAAAEAAAQMKARVEQAFTGGGIGNVVQFGLQGLFAKMGESGQIASSALAGFQAAGIWGAIIAVILELLSRFERFGEVMAKSQASVNKAITDMTSGLSELVDGLLELMDALQPLKDLIHGILNPILKILGTALKGLAETIGVLIAILEPILSLLGEALGGIAGLLKELFTPLKAIGNVLKPILGLFSTLAKVLDPLAPLFIIIGNVLKVVSLIILGIFWVIGKIVNGIVQFFDPNAKEVINVSGPGGIEDQINEVTGSFADTVQIGGNKVGDALDGAAERIDSSGKTTKPADEKDPTLGKVTDVATKHAGESEYEKRVRENKVDTSSVAGSGFQSSGTGGSVVVLPPVEEEQKRGAERPVSLTRAEWDAQNKATIEAALRAFNPNISDSAVKAQLDAEYKSYVEGLKSNVTLTKDAFALLHPEITVDKLDKAFEAYLVTLGYVIAKTDEQAKNLDKINEAFTNAPTGYKLAFARFGSIAGIGNGPAFSEKLGKAGDKVEFNGPITIMANNVDEFLDEISRRFKRKMARANGAAQRWDPAAP